MSCTTTTFINAFCMSLLCMLRRGLGIHLLHPPPTCRMHCHCSTIRVLWQLGWDTSHVTAGLKYPRGGKLEMDRDLEGQSRGYMYDMTSLQTVPCHIAGMGALSCWKKNVSNSLIYWQDMLLKDFIHLVLACK